MTGAPFAVGLVFVMYAYSGWNAATYIAGEVRDPQRSLPRALLVAATLIVIALYVSLNAVFLYTTPVDKLAGQIDVAQIAGKHIFGDAGGSIVGGLICLGLISTISAMTWIGPRVTMVMGEDIPMLRVFSRKADNGAPTLAILFQTSVTTLLLLTQSFEAVLEFIQFSLTFCSFLAVLGVIVLRIRRAGAGAPVPRVGVSADAVRVPRRHGLHDVLPAHRAPARSRWPASALLLTGLAIFAVSVVDARRRTASEVSKNG